MLFLLSPCPVSLYVALFAPNAPRLLVSIVIIHAYSSRHAVQNDSRVRHIPKPGCLVTYRPVVGVPVRGHVRLQREHVLTLDFYPDQDDRPVQRLRVQERLTYSVTMLC